MILKSQIARLDSAEVTKKLKKCDAVINAPMPKPILEGEHFYMETFTADRRYKDVAMATKTLCIHELIERGLVSEKEVNNYFLSEHSGFTPKLMDARLQEILDAPDSPGTSG